MLGLRHPPEIAGSLLLEVEAMRGLLTYQTVREKRRGLVTLLLAAAISLAGATGATAQKQFDVGGTIVGANGQILTILTSDVIGREQPILVDVSWLKGFQYQVGDPVQLTILARESDTYLAIGIVGESPFANGQDFGVQERFTVKDDSIQAGVGNVPADDEALAKQHRGNNLRRQGGGKKLYDDDD